MTQSTAEQRENIYAIAQEITQALRRNDTAEAVRLLTDLHYADQADVFDALDDETQDRLIPLLDISTTADLLEELEEADAVEAVEDMPTERLADVLDEMEPDEAADLLGDLPPEQASALLEEMEDSDEVLPLLKYPDDTAGGLMTTSFIALRRGTTAQEAIEYLRAVGPDVDVPYYLYVEDETDRLIGIVGMRELVVAAPETPIERIMDPDVIYVRADEDQEEVARVMTRYDLTAIPVVDDDMRLIGVITYDDILDVVEDEVTEDIYHMANVSDAELTPESPVWQQVRGRLPWLLVNTGTAAFASWVVSHYESTISEVAALAIFQSIVTGQGGNAGSQNVAMMVRTIALGDLESRQMLPILYRQALVGLIQGLAVGAVVGVGAYLWRGNPYLALVVGLALVGNLFIGGLIGTLVPSVLKWLKLDPALASSVFVTAVTDAGGFFIYYTLAGLVLRHL